ncbi:hypothetical protein [Desulfatitalea alkaliphila]|uniref:Uncharacterized protein n=1 Tax=Desulfatitalea alkaliphila TaxID=2929485 RepID=A0AA41QZN3_9BACT|nr:hypothetical protein [Desulfatitalea alkaliphila]MCJ8500087.1 hypothetical protein [Desulfatitalea alkaliphila]
MSIRLLARDLYLSQQQVARLQKALADAPDDRRPAIAQQLRRALAERNALRRALDGRIGR